MKRVLFLISACLWLCLGKSYSQSTLPVKGTVTDAITGKPVYASLRFEPYMQPDSVRIISNDARTGQFSYMLNSENSYMLEVFAPGYLPAIHNLSTLTSEIAPIAITLSPLLQGDYFQVSNLTFEQNKAVITGGFESLQAVANYLVQNQTFKLQLEGHTETKGNAKAQMRLSRERLLCVKNYLASKGVNPSRMKLKAFGGSKPITTDTQGEAQAQNRRVEFRLIK
jgi:outer membrane protein OmpA-like peptidoglycan-associated protein